MHNPTTPHIAAIVAGLLVAAAGCTTDFAPDGLESDPVGVLNVMVTADSLMTASVSHSWPFGHERPASTAVADAQVTLTLAPSGRRVAMTYDPATQRFVSTVRAASGEEVAVEARTSLFGVLRGSTRVPEAVEIDSLKVDYTIEHNRNSMVVGDAAVHYENELVAHYRLSFTDPPGQTNYYLLAGSNLEGDGEEIFGEHRTPLDAVFGSGRSEMMVFSDRTINGRPYTLRFRTRFPLESPWNWPRDPATGEYCFVDTIRLYSISYDYYAYLLSIFRKYGGLNADLEDIGLVEPTAVYTNITGGTGIVCSQALRELRIDFSSHIP